jgi:hypothetical protein
LPGYSGTPLAKKLGIADGCNLHPIGAPPDYRALLEPLPPTVKFSAKADASTTIVHLFTTRQNELRRNLVSLRKALASNAAVWVSWPKKASKVPTDVTEDIIRDLALPLGFVDIKVCAVTDIWSGLKLVVRKELR